MKNEYHILNGDSLLEQFPSQLPGERLVARECLIDGVVSGDTLEEFFLNRSRFLTENYGGTIQEYELKVKQEFIKITEIANGVINLWFEDDLFCQTNFWFVVYLLHASNRNNELFLVRPQTHTPYGFAGLDANELQDIYQNRTKLEEVGLLSSLWEAYRDGNLDRMEEIGQRFSDNYPFIQEAIAVHFQRLPTTDSPGRPIETLKAIMTELGTSDFVPVFREFSRREYIYGFGDLQVKRLIDQIDEI